MNKCPRCENEKLVENQKFCQICGLKLDTSKEGAIASLKELHDNPLVLPSERQALEYAIKELERTAQEVSVQEQFLNEISSGSKTINQIRKAYGLKAIEGGDQYMSKIQLRTILLEALLGNEVTIFIEEKGSNLYKVEVIDSNKREKLLIINLNKLSKFRYCLLDYQSF